MRLLTICHHSADTWVPNSKCPATVCPLAKFDEAASSTFKPLDEAFNITYGIGNVGGQYGLDTMTIGGAAVLQQQFGLVTQATDIYSSNSATGVDDKPGDHNGILGLGFPPLTQSSKNGLQGYNPFVFNLVSQKIIKEPVFSIFLNGIFEAGWSGEIIFGGVDNTKFAGDMTYLPVAAVRTNTQSSASASITTTNNYYFWMVFAQGVAVKNSPTGVNPKYKLPQIGSYILDTGTTLTYLPTQVATEVITGFVGKDKFVLDKAENIFVVNCSDAINNPAQFELHMSQTDKPMDKPITLSVPASQLFLPIDGTTMENSKKCYFGIAPTTRNIGPNMYLIGETVLRSAYMVFDMGKNRIGIAASKDIGGSVTVNGAIVSNSSVSVTKGTAESTPNAAENTSDAGFVLKSSISSVVAGLVVTVALFAL